MWFSFKVELLIGLGKVYKYFGERVPSPSQESSFFKNSLPTVLHFKGKLHICFKEILGCFISILLSWVDFRILFFPYPTITDALYARDSITTHLTVASDYICSISGYAPYGRIASSPCY